MSFQAPILLIEDDLVDRMTVKRALHDIGAENDLIIAGDGGEALEYLGNKENSRPAFILLDLNMPRMNGIEFLDAIKNNTDLKKIPVVVLTTSEDEEDRFKSFELGIAGYIVKPLNYSRFVEVIRTIHLYWEINSLPEG